MDAQEEFLKLTPPERAAMLYSIGNWTQKALFARFGVSYSEFRNAREDLIERGILRPDGTATDVGAKAVPAEFWLEIRSSLKSQLNESNEKVMKTLDEVYFLRSETLKQKAEITSLESRLAETERELADLQDMRDTLEKFKPMEVSLDWVRAAAALTLIEAAMKRKLEDLEVKVEDGIKFNVLRNSLEEALKKQGKQLRPRLISLSQLSDARNKIVHTGHRFTALPKEEADLIVNLAADIIEEIMAD